MVQMKKYKSFYLIGLSCFLLACGNPIKNEEKVVEEEAGVELVETPMEEEINEFNTPEDEKVLGYWIGLFLQDSTDEYIAYNEAVYWDRRNKINISIERIKKDSVFGRTIVAGNDRPFKGTFERSQKADNLLKFDCFEPGDHKYDGRFTFSIVNDTLLIGKWRAFNQIDIPKRKYELKLTSFKYNPEVNLQEWSQFVNWQKKTRTVEYTDTIDGEIDKWIQEEFATTTPIIYEVNASVVKLKKADLEKMKKEDLRVIRNTIYARHGYSFKNRPLRYFFDNQDWYVPVSTDIRKELTDLEKENIKLLLTFEKNAAEYYDSFGR